MEQSLEAKVDSTLVIDWVQSIGREPSATVPLLQAIQSEYGYLPRKAMDIVIKNSEISGSQLFGVATFYSQFRMTPVGRHLIKVCHGTACHVTGADRLNTSVRYMLDIMDEDKDTADNGSYTIEDVACVGCCSQAPVMVIDELVLGYLKGSTAQRQLKKHARKCEEILPKK